MSINQVSISGNLTRDAELRQTKGGTPVLTYSVAVNERKRNPQSGEWEDVPNYFDCITYGNYATSMQPHMTKGLKVAVSGHLQQRSWEKDGTKRSKVEIVATEIVTLTAQRDQQQGQKVPYSKPQIIEPPAPAEVYDEDIPF